jgi:hypothetical protein
MKMMQPDEESFIESRINEAETYRSMGLLKESIGVLEKILSDMPSLDPQSTQNIKKKIELLKKEISGHETSDSQGFSTEDISLIKETLSRNEELPAILDSAFAFKELGLYGDAISEYEKLLYLECPLSKIIPEIAECLLRIDTPAQVLKRVQKMLSDRRLGRRRGVQFTFSLAKEMEKKEQKTMAADLFRLAEQIQHHSKGLKGRTDPPAVTAPREDPSIGQEDISVSQERRRDERTRPRIPEFVYVEFKWPKTAKEGKTHRLNVLDYSKHGLGLLVSEKDSELLQVVNPGDIIEDMTFFARWTMITVKAIVRHKSKIEDGLNKGQHVLGVESKDLIDSCIIPK